MATQAQTSANQRNAQASTGPRTAQGKSASSGNATKHGLSAAFRVLTNENQEEFDELIAEFNRTFAPTTAYERFLVEEMAQSRWRLARARRLEAAVIELIVGSADPADADFRLAAAIINNTVDPLVVLQRHAAAMERTGYRALKQLLALRKLEAQAARDAARQNEANLNVSPDAKLKTRHKTPHPEAPANNSPAAAESRCPPPNRPPPAHDETNPIRAT
jgi:hypothetical protein